MDKPRVIAPNNLDKVLRDRGLSTRDIAEMTAASPVHVGKLRRGVARPSRSLARLLALATGVPEGFLFPRTTEDTGRGLNAQADAQ